MSGDTNNKQGNAPGPLHPMHLVAYPGLPILGMLVAMQDSVSAMNTSSMAMASGIASGLLLSMLLAWKTRNFPRAFFIGLAVSLGVMLGAAAAGWSGRGLTTTFLLPTALIIGVYTGVLWFFMRVVDPPARFESSRWIPLILAALLTLGLEIRAVFFTDMHGGLIVWCVYLLAWTTYRTYYFCNAMRGTPSRPLIEQACSEMLKGMILLQATAITCLTTGPFWTVSLALTFVVMTLAGILSPWKIRRK